MSMMTPELFEQALDRFGADLDRWPTEERLQAETLLRSENAQATAAFERAQSLDHALADMGPAAAPAYLAPRIIALASEQPQTDWLGRLGAWFGAAVWRGALAGAAPLVLGFAFGLAGGTTDTPFDSEIAWVAVEDSVTTAFDDWEAEETL